MKSNILHIRSKIRQLRRNKRMKAIYRSLVPSNALCFDIGANVGHRTAIFRQLGATVVAVEPVERSFECLKKRFGRDKKVHLVPAAVAATAGQAKLYLSDVSEVCTLSQAFVEAYSKQKAHPITWEQQTTTTTTTLDHLIDTYGLPDFCKIDIEGYELKALKGLSHTLPAFSFEYNQRLKNMTLDCLKLLSTQSQLVYNFSAYESGRYYYNQWISNKQIIAFIKKLNPQILTGDVYVKQKF